MADDAPVVVRRSRKPCGPERGRGSTPPAAANNYIAFTMEDEPARGRERLLGASYREVWESCSPSSAKHMPL